MCPTIAERPHVPSQMVRFVHTRPTRTTGDGLGLAQENPDEETQVHDIGETRTVSPCRVLVFFDLIRFFDFVFRSVVGGDQLNERIEPACLDV